ncbi:hypothetical protein [Ferdinandcohnia sp. Marseille-Q9671]
MKKLVHFLFGKPFKKEDNFRSKYFNFMYKAVVIFYFFALSIQLILAFLNPIEIIGFIMAAIFFPVAFRAIISLLSKVNKVEREV